MVLLPIILRRKTMKRILSLSLAIICLFSFVGCSLFKKDYEAEPKEFKFQEMSLTLTDSFYLDEDEGDTVWYESFNDTSVSIDRFPLSKSDKESFPNALAYAETLNEQIESDNLSEVIQKDGIIYMTYTAETLGLKFTYFLAVFMSENAVWHVHFICDTPDFEEYEPHFLKWAKTVSIDG